MRGRWSRLSNPQVVDVQQWRLVMIRTILSPRTFLMAVAVSVLWLVTIDLKPAGAVVICKTAGVPQGCVVRAPVATAAVVAPAAVVVRPVAVVRPGVVARGRVVNRGGPVNRVGLR
jgi:hypothetical protein